MSDGIPFGPYVLVKRLARGGMAEIFLARREGPEGFSRELVVKRILPHLTADADFTSMFLEEARIAARLSHPNVVHVYDFGVVDGTYYIAMELVRGVDLRVLVTRAAERARAAGRPGALPAHHAAKILSLVCEGLAHAHGLAIDGRPAGVVHRDITPSNVLISFEGAVKVADFGIAKATRSARHEPTQHGIVKGKRAYLSPEQSRGDHVDARSDLFNAGILLFESLAGAPLFSQEGFREQMEGIRRGEVPGERHLARMPLPLVSIIRRCLAERPSARHQDALALRADLEAFLRTWPDPADSVELGSYVRRLFPEELAADVKQPRAAGTVVMTSSGSVHVDLDDTVDSEPIPVADSDAPEGEVAGAKTVVAPPPIHTATRVLADTALLPVTDATAASSRVVAAAAPGTARPRAPAEDPFAVHADAVFDSSAETDVIAPQPPALTDPASTQVYVREEPRARRWPIVWAVAGGLLVAAVIGASVAWQVVSSDGGGAAQVLASRDPAALSGTPVVGPVNPPPPRLLLPPPIPVPALGRAHLRVLSHPEGATVVVGGQPSGRTPLALEVEPGVHAIEVRLDGYASQHTTATINAPGETSSVSFVLARARGSGGSRPPAALGMLTISTTPWSKIYLGSRLLGTTPLTNVRLPAGRHVLTLRAPGRPPRDRAVVIQPNAETRVREVL